MSDFWISIFAAIGIICVGVTFLTIIIVALKRVYDTKEEKRQSKLRWTQLQARIEAHEARIEQGNRMLLEVLSKIQKEKPE